LAEGFEIYDNLKGIVWFALNNPDLGPAHPDLETSVQQDVLDEFHIRIMGTITWLFRNSSNVSGSPQRITSIPHQSALIQVCVISNMTRERVS
jgi:hypothetical protein